jgi:hypothetical protein
MASSGPPSPYPRQKTCHLILRAFYNDARIHEGSRESWIQEVPRTRESVTGPDKGQPPGTRTVIVDYFLRARPGLRVAVARKFVVPGGALGASGTPQLQMFLSDGIELTPLHRNDQSCLWDRLHPPKERAADDR